MVRWPWVRVRIPPSTALRKVVPPHSKTPLPFVSTEKKKKKKKKKRNRVGEMKSTGEGGGVITPLALFLFLYLPFCHGGAGEVATAAAAVGGGCGGRGVGECGLGDAVGMEAEAAGRRALQQSQEQRYISYRFLNGDVVPCTTPGVSYYSCHAMPSGNPHTRGCFTIARCRDGYP